MNKFSKVIALTLSATMIFGSSLTAFAEDPDPAAPAAASTSGESTGAGASEGHVEKKATSVILPTIAEGATPFAYTMDPERLISETSHAKYGDTVEFPASGDTGVYFNNGKKGGNGDDKDNIVYANSSVAQTVTNKSSHSIDLTVKAEAVAGENDIPLVASTDIEEAEEASLYLGLKVGDAAAVAVDEETAATKTVTIEGTAGNFDIFVTSDGKGYEYRALNLAEYKALNEANADATQDDYDATWKTSEFKLEGAVTEGKEITSNTSAPSVKVTWSWVDPTEGPQLAVTAAGVFTITGLTAEKNYKSLEMSGELSDGTIAKFHVNNDPKAVTWDESDYDASTGGSLVCTVTNAWGKYWNEQKEGQAIKVILTLSDDTTVEKTDDS